MSLGDGDTVIFSSKIIPGNERTIGDLHNRLLRRGIEVITENDAGVHVSGHPCRGELRQMYQWIRPQIAVPVHGEARHMQAHGALARALQVPEPVFVENGDLLRLAPGPVTRSSAVRRPGGSRWMVSRSSRPTTSRSARGAS